MIKEYIECNDWHNVMNILKNMNNGMLTELMGVSMEDIIRIEPLGIHEMGMQDTVYYLLSAFNCDFNYREYGKYIVEECKKMKYCENGYVRNWKLCLILGE